MLSKVTKYFMIVLMLLIGLLFVSNIYVLGNREAAIEMHEDLAPSASALMANIKVLNCFVTGILYLIAAYGIMKKKYNLSIAGLIGFILFDGFYIVQLIMWTKTHPGVWLGFSIFGTISFLIGLFSWRNWQKRTV